MTRTFTTCFAILLLCASSLHAAPVDWNYWTSGQTGQIFAGNDVINVTYSSADYHDVIYGVPTWRQLPPGPTARFLTTAWTSTTTS